MKPRGAQNACGPAIARGLLQLAARPGQDAAWEAGVMDRTRDGAVLAPLLGGAALADVTAFFLATLHFRGSDSALLGLPAWQAVPVATALKFVLVAAAVVAALSP